jgi:hypothetical protein
MKKNYQTLTAQANISKYRTSSDYSLSSVYGRYSDAKARAWRYCEQLCAKHNGWGLKVLSYNTFMFTAGFLFEDPETGVVQFMFITPNYDIAVNY